MGRPPQAAQVRLGEVQPLIRQVVDRIFVMFCKENAMTSLHCVRVPCKHDLVCLATTPDRRPARVFVTKSN